MFRWSRSCSCGRERASWLNSDSGRTEWNGRSGGDGPGGGVTRRGDVTGENDGWQGEPT